MSERIAVIGLGYVGTVVAASLAAAGRAVVGVDRRVEVVDALGRGVAPIPEPELPERLAAALARGTLTVTTDLDAAVASAAASVLCVGTPVGEDGQLLVGDLLEACAAVVRASGDRRHVIVIRSTVPPGLYRAALERIDQVSPGAAGTRIAVALNPEFLREGSAVRDLEEPELVVVATEHAAAAAFLDDLHAAHRDRVRRTDPATAELLKLVNNAWHALKVSFANEVARVARPIDVDPFAVMSLLCADRRLNTSAAYLRPGLPFGGACLVKDVKALVSHADEHGVDVPVLGAVLPSNEAHLSHLVGAVLAHRPARVAIVGIGFKPGASDVRDSAPVRLVHRLLEQGVRVAVADSGILDSAVPPVGIDALRAALGDARARAAADVAGAISDADVVVVGHPCAADRAALVALRPRIPILDASGDLTRALSDAERRVLSPVVVLAR